MRGIPMLEILNKMDKALHFILKTLVVVLFIAMVILIAAQVYTRFFTDSSLTWSEELARYTMVYMVFLAAVLVAREKGHICIDDVVRRLSVKGRTAVLCISSLLQILFFATVVWGAYRLFPTASLRVSPAIGIPIPYVYFCVPLSCVMMLVYTVRDLVHLFTRKENG